MRKGIINNQGGLKPADKALLIPENIKAGVTIDGVVGALPDGTGKKRKASGFVTMAPNSSKVISVGFACGMIRVELNATHNNATNVVINANGDVSSTYTNYGTLYFTPTIVYSKGSGSFTINTNQYTAKEIKWTAYEE